MQTTPTTGFSSLVENGDPSSSSSSLRHNPKERRRGGGGGGGEGGKRGGAAVKLSKDPQSVAARQRRHRISDRFRVLKSLVPGGSKLDTVSMLEEAIHYVKFLKAQIWLHQAAMMLPPEDPFPSPPPFLCGIGDGDASSMASLAMLLPDPQQVVSSSTASPVLPPLPPLPGSYLEGEEEAMFLYHGLNYY